MKINDVIVYLSSIHAQKPGRKIDALNSFAEGAIRCGASVHVETSYNYRPSKLAVILGWASPQTHALNIKLRAEIIRRQKESGHHVMSVDANCFKFADAESLYLRYSLNDVQYDLGEYANKNSDSTRWSKLSRDLSIDIRTWRNHGNYILFLMQRDGGWSMKGLKPLEWAREKIQKVREITDMPIVLRPHPGAVSNLRSLVGENITISDSLRRPLMKDLKHAKCAFVFNSSSGVASILHGVPLFADDSSSVCWEVANKDISQLLNPVFPDRQQWIFDLAACHWTDEESRRGLIYQKFLPFIK